MTLLSSFTSSRMRSMVLYQRMMFFNSSRETGKPRFANVQKDSQSLRQGHTDFKRRFPEIGTKRLIVHNYKDTKSEQPASFQIDPTQVDPQNTIKQLQSIRKHLSFGMFSQKSKDTLQRVYLPADYPDSVTKEYLPFTIYQNLMSISNTAMSFLSTQSLFVALGGGSTEAQLAAAAYTWVLKDAVGQFGGIMFAARYGQNFDEDIKKWRFMATLALNISIYIEVMALAFPHLFLFLASTANAGKNICFLLASASRAQINLRFAKTNNVGDISGKSVSQFTTSSIFGMLLGSALSQFINVSSLSQLIPTFLVLSAGTLTCSFLSSQIIDENYLNNSRAALVFNYYIENRNNPDFKIADVHSVNMEEKFYVPNFLNLQRCKYIRFGEFALIDIISGSYEAEPVQSLMLQLHKEQRRFTYTVKQLPRSKRFLRHFTNNGRDFRIHINMHKQSTNQDQLHAYLFARILDYELMKPEQPDVSEAIRFAEREFLKIDLQQFSQKLKDSGWSLDYIYLDPKKNRYHVEAELIEKVTPSDIPVLQDKHK